MSTLTHSDTIPRASERPAVEDEPVLTVTDSRNGGQRGIIHFAIVGGRVRFYINEAAAADRNLSISSRLLALAISVNQR